MNNQCVADTSTYTQPSFFLTCTSNGKLLFLDFCCDPGAIVDSSGFCNQPAASSGLCINGVGFPSSLPTFSPTYPNTFSPTRKPSLLPTARPSTAYPSVKPTSSPSYRSTSKPSAIPSYTPSKLPTTKPSTNTPSIKPIKPTGIPSNKK